MENTDRSTNIFSWFRRIAFAEGISFLVLLLIAMPLKYMAGFPIAVTVFGSIHGILYVAFLVLAREVKSEYKMNWNWMVKAFIASILPFGTMVMDRQWKKEQEGLAAKAAA